MNKKLVIYSFIVLFIAITAFTVKFAPSTYKVLAKESKVKWIGKKVTGQHNGSIDVKSGEVILDNNTLKGGTILIDMTSIVDEDIQDEESKKKLVKHLKSDDFFGVEKYPTSKFIIKTVKPITDAEAGKPNYEVNGDLTIKASTQSITVPVLVSVEKGVVKVKANFKIDRTKYDVRYGSSSFFDNLGDKAISDDFEMDLDIVAKK